MYINKQEGGNKTVKLHINFSQDVWITVGLNILFVFFTEITVRGRRGPLWNFGFCILGWDTVLILTIDRLLLGTGCELFRAGGEGGSLLLDVS